MAIFPIVSIRIRTVFGRLVWWIPFFSRGFCVTEAMWIGSRWLSSWFWRNHLMIAEPSSCRQTWRRGSLQKNDFANFTRQLGFLYMGGVNPPQTNVEFQNLKRQVKCAWSLMRLVMGYWNAGTKIDSFPWSIWVNSGWWNMPSALHSLNFAKRLSLVGDQRWRSREKCKGWQLFSMVRQSTSGHYGCLKSVTQLEIRWQICPKNTRHHSLFESNLGWFRKKLFV